MLAGGIHLWRLSTAGDGNLGLSCDRDGLYIGRTPLIECCTGGYVLRSQSDLERLFKRSSTRADLDRLMRGLGVVKSALDENNLCLAQIAALQLRMPDLPGLLARAELEAEDRLIKTERGGDGLARAGWDPDKHPRTGIPPNPGWFARPTGRVRKKRRARAGLANARPEECSIPPWHRPRTQLRTDPRYCPSRSAALPIPTTPLEHWGWTGPSSAIYFMTLKTTQVLPGMTMSG